MRIQDPDNPCCGYGYRFIYDVVWHILIQYMGTSPPLMPDWTGKRGCILRMKSHSLTIFLPTPVPLNAGTLRLAKNLFNEYSILPSIQRLSYLYLRIPVPSLWVLIARKKIHLFQPAGNNFNRRPDGRSEFFLWITDCTPHQFPLPGWDPEDPAERGVG